MRSEDNSGGCMEKVECSLAPSQLSFGSLALFSGLALVMAVPPTLCLP